jgi:hypothetical protein
VRKRYLTRLKIGTAVSLMRNLFLSTVSIKIILMSLNEHCINLFNYLLGSLFIYVYLIFKIPTQLVIYFKRVTVSHDRSYTLCHVICSKWPLLEDDLTILAWNRWPLAMLKRWPLKRVKLYSNISWAGLKVIVRQRWPFIWGDR